MQNERTRIHDKYSSIVIPGRERGVFEGLQIEGTYHVICTRPKPEDVAKYLHLIAQQEQLFKAGRLSDAIIVEREALALSTEKQWEDTFHNLIVDAGKNHNLDTHLAGSGYTVTGPFMGLISLVSYSAIAAGDTMASHAGWLEAGNANAPTYTAPRKTAAWNAASGGAKALSAALSFAITGTGTVKGAFIVLGSGASSTIDNTGGTLFSAGLFSGGDKAVVNTDTLNVSYTATLT
jgi:hypothetical protein